MEDEFKDEIGWDLLARYFAGEATAAERAEIERWAAEDPARNAALAELRELWAIAGAVPSSARTADMWDSIARQMHSSTSGGAPAPPRFGQDAHQASRLSLLTLRWPRGWWASGAIAVSLAMVVAVTVLWLYPQARRSAEGAGAGSVREYETGRGQWAQIRLADGTRVALGPESSLRILAMGATGSREAHLAGEAVFEVVHDARRPFLVYSAHAVTEDLGTKFGVRAYPDESRVRVVVVEGSVALRSSTAPERSGTVLHPGQLGQLDAAGKVEVESGVDTNAYLAWTRGRIAFRQASLREVATHLERWYDVPIEISDSATAERQITLDMPALPLADVLGAVTVPLDLRHRRADGTVLLYP